MQNMLTAVIQIIIVQTQLGEDIQKSSREITQTLPPEAL